MSSVPVEYTDCISEFPEYDTKQSDGGAEYPFIAIAPRFTLARIVFNW